MVLCYKSVIFVSPQHRFLDLSCASVHSAVMLFIASKICLVIHSYIYYFLLILSCSDGYTPGCHKEHPSMCPLVDLNQIRIFTLEYWAKVFLHGFTTYNQIIFYSSYNCFHSHQQHLLLRPCKHLILSSLDVLVCIILDYR